MFNWLNNQDLDILNPILTQLYRHLLSRVCLVQLERLDVLSNIMELFFFFFFLNIRQKKYFQNRATFKRIGGSLETV